MWNGHGRGDPEPGSGTGGEDASRERTSGARHRPIEGRVGTGEGSVESTRIDFRKQTITGFRPTRRPKRGFLSISSNQLGVDGNSYYGNPPEDTGRPRRPGGSAPPNERGLG